MTVPDHVLKNRHNKTAIGMTKTLYRSMQSDRASNDARTLSVRGTLDRLGFAMKYRIRREVKVTLYLNELGKRRLEQLRRKKETE